MTRAIAALALAGLCCARWQRTIDIDHRTGLSLHVARTDRGSHDHPTEVPRDVFRNALLKDGNLVDADIERVEDAAVKEFPRLRRDEELVIRAPGVDYYVFVDAGALQILRGEDGPKTSYAFHATAPATGGSGPGEPSVPTIAMTEWNASGMEPAVANALLERFATQLSSVGGVRVTTPRDIVQALGAERQRQLLGCGEGSCLAELAGALGAEASVLASVVKIDESYTVTLRAVATANAKELASVTGRVKGTEQLQDWLDAHAIDLAKRILAAVRSAP